jgi:hypothetical protein
MDGLARDAITPPCVEDRENFLLSRRPQFWQKDVPGRFLKPQNEHFLIITSAFTDLNW